MSSRRSEVGTAGRPSCPRPPLSAFARPFLGSRVLPTLTAYRGLGPALATLELPLASSSQPSQSPSSSLPSSITLSSSSRDLVTLETSLLLVHGNEVRFRRDCQPTPLFPPLHSRIPALVNPALHCVEITPRTPAAQQRRARREAKGRGSWTRPTRPPVGSERAGSQSCASLSTSLVGQGAVRDAGAGQYPRCEEGRGACVGQRYGYRGGYKGGTRRAGGRKEKSASTTTAIRQCLQSLGVSTGSAERQDLKYRRDMPCV